MLAYGIKNK